jgi:predicted metal-dependent enzyme (double-stranded beta helix superfamily)
VSFEVETFVTACQRAAAEVDPAGAVREVVGAAIGEGLSIDSALGTQRRADNDSLFLSDDLTVQRIIWIPGIPSVPHEHRMWAVVGVYAGEEVNHIYERSRDGLTELRTVAVVQGSVFVLDANAIHAVECARDEWTAALHVYGGDIVNGERNAWGPDGREVPFAEEDSARRAMFAPMRALAEEYATPIDDEARYLAVTALMAATKRERRYPGPAEARRIVAAAWRLEL